MEVKSKQVTTTVVTYVANDGKEFPRQSDCERYEFLNTLRLSSGSVWLVYRKRHGMNSVEVFSTEELANKSLANLEGREVMNYAIEEHFIDIRFLTPTRG